MKKFLIKFFVFILLLVGILGTTVFFSRKYEKNITKFLGKFSSGKKTEKSKEVVDINIYKANTQNIMLKLNLENIDVEPAVKSVLRLGAEEVLTEKGYHLISEDSEKEYLEKENKTECNDTICIVSMAKSLSVKGVFVINAIKLGNSYVFKLTYIDLAKNAASKIKSMIFEGELNNAKKLLVFSKKMITIIINDKSITKIKTTSEKEEINNDIKVNENSKDSLKKENIDKEEMKKDETAKDNEVKDNEVKDNTTKDDSKKNDTKEIKNF